MTQKKKKHSRARFLQENQKIKQKSVSIPPLNYLQMKKQAIRECGLFFLLAF